MAITKEQKKEIFKKLKVYEADNKSYLYVHKIDLLNILNEVL